MKVKDGKTAWEVKQYHVATKYLPKEFEKAKTKSDKAKTAFLLADSYKHLHQPEKALVWYKKAYDNGYGSEALKGYAYELKATGQYPEAIQAFKELGQEIGSPYEYRKEIQSAELAQTWVKDAPYTGFTIEPVAFNSPQADYGPTLASNGDVIFTSDRASASGKEVYGWTGRKFSDVFVAPPASETVTPYTGIPVNTEANEGTMTTDASGKIMVFTRCQSSTEKRSNQYCQLYLSEKTEMGWTELQLLPFCKPEINYGTPVLTANGSRLYFAANSLEGWGGFDLYSCDRSPNGWEEPQLLPKVINSPGNDLWPSLDKDTLYFASDGIPGMGGLDVFKTWRNGNSWVPAQNLKAPVNTHHDDFALVVDRLTPAADGIKKQGYFTSNRNGSDDIFRFKLGTPPPKPKVDSVPSKQGPAKMILEVYVLEKIFQDADNPNSQVLGRKPLKGVKLDIRFDKQQLSHTTKEDGLYEIELQANTDYQFNAVLEGYLRNGERFTTKGIASDPSLKEQRFEVEIVMDKVYKNKEIVLENIYYDFNKYDIRDDAKPTLDQLTKILQQNPGIRIELGSHTDCRGNDGYNLNLSQQRAQAAVDYLIANGIVPDRLSARGYGESQPAVTCDCNRCTESEHQSNRRTTFKILE